VNLAKERKRQREEMPPAVEIAALPRPKGEAGSTKKGFNLQEAMGLNDNALLYNEILVCHADCQGNVMVTDIVELPVYF
jgi:hypothetical protein